MEGNKYISFIRQGLNPRLRVFLICLLISAFIWTTMVLSKVYNTHISVQVEWENTGNLIVVSNLENESLDIALESQGFGIFTQNWFSKNRTIAIDPKNPAVSRAGFRYKLTTSKLRNQLNEEIGKAKIIRSIQPDSLVFYLCPNSSKELEVRPSVTHQEVDAGLIPGVINSEPSKIIVKGPSCILDTLTYVSTENLSLSKDKREGLISIQLPSSYLSSDVEQVFVKAPLYPIIEQSRKVKIQVQNTPQGFSVKTFPDSVELSFKMSVEKARLVRANDFSVIASLPKDTISLKNLKRIKLELTHSPENAQDIILSKDRVEFVILPNP